MKRCLSIALIFAVLASMCLTLSGCMDASLVGATVTTELHQGTVSEPNTFENDLLRIEFGFASDRVVLTLTNKSDTAIYLDWEGSVLVDPMKATHRLVHSGIKYIDSSQSQSPTLIPPGARIDDVMIPANNIRWEHQTWITGSLFDRPDQLIGESFGIYLSLRSAGGEPELYRFDFTITGIEKRKTLFGD